MCWVPTQAHCSEPLWVVEFDDLQHADITHAWSCSLQAQDASDRASLAATQRQRTLPPKAGDAAGRAADDLSLEEAVSHLDEQKGQLQKECVQLKAQVRQHSGWGLVGPCEQCLSACSVHHVH